MTKVEATPSTHERAAADHPDLGHKVRQMIDDMRERYGWWRAFADWEDRGELRGVLDALGMEEQQIPVFVRNYPEAKRLLTAMMGRIGAEIAPEPEAIRQDLIRTCALCSSRDDCRRWLQSGAREGYQAFCPNTHSFGKLRPWH